MPTVRLYGPSWVLQVSVLSAIHGAHGRMYTALEFRESVNVNMTIPLSVAHHSGYQVDTDARLSSWSIHSEDEPL